MNNEEWLQWRRGGIGSTDACVIMGVAPWRDATPRNLWEEKVLGVSERLETAVMTRGKKMEPVARHWFEETMNVTVFPQCKVHPSCDWIRSTLDGMDLEEKVVVEIKCPLNKDDHSVAVNKKVPEKYWPQVQHQLLVTGLDGMYYCSFDGSHGAIVEVPRDNAYIADMLEKERQFWDMVLSKEPPPLTERDFSHKDGNEKWRFLAPQWMEAYSWASKEKELRAQLIALCDDQNSMGHGIKITKSLVEGAIDYKQVMTDHPEINWEAYRKKSFIKWTFRNIQEKDA